MSRLRILLSDVSTAAVLSLILLLTGALSPVWSRPPTQPEVIIAGRTKDATKSSSKPSGTSFDVVSKHSPESVAHLRAIENRVKSLARKVTRCTVAVRRGQAQGSGVIVSQDGYVLTAAHVPLGVGERWPIRRRLAKNCLRITFQRKPSNLLCHWWRGLAFR